MTRPLATADVIHGYAYGAFGRDHYHCVRIEAAGPDWIVARELDAEWEEPSFAAGRESLKLIQQARDEPCPLDPPCQLEHHLTQTEDLRVATTRFEGVDAVTAMITIDGVRYSYTEAVTGHAWQNAGENYREMVRAKARYELGAHLGAHLPVSLTEPTTVEPIDHPETPNRS